MQVPFKWMYSLEFWIIRIPWICLWINHFTNSKVCLYMEILSAFFKDIKNITKGQDSVLSPYVWILLLLTFFCLSLRIWLEKNNDNCTYLPHVHILQSSTTSIPQCIFIQQRPCINSSSISETICGDCARSYDDDLPLPPPPNGSNPGSPAQARSSGFPSLSRQALVRNEFFPDRYSLPPPRAYPMPLSTTAWLRPGGGGLQGGHRETGPCLSTSSGLVGGIGVLGVSLGIAGLIAYSVLQVPVLRVQLCESSKR